ncbi:MAG: hypothetical protein WBS24_16820 [Terriglobales bacterium]
MSNAMVCRRLILLLPSSLLSFLAVPNMSAQAVVNKVGFCDVARNPELYDNREITVTAQYDSDGVEREGLSDPACKESGFALQMLHHTEGKDQLRAVLHGGYPGTLDKTVSGTFTGVFHWMPKEHPTRVLTVRSMEGFSVHQKTSPTNPAGGPGF